MMPSPYMPNPPPQPPPWLRPLHSPLTLEHEHMQGRNIFTLGYTIHITATTAVVVILVTTGGAGHSSSGGMYPAVQFGSTPKLGHRSSSPIMSKLESIASSAVRAADKVHASLIIVYTHTGLPAATCLLPYVV